MVWIWRSAVGGHQIAVEVAPGRDTRGWNSMCCVVFGGCCCRCCLRGEVVWSLRLRGTLQYQTNPQLSTPMLESERSIWCFDHATTGLRSPSTTGCIVGHHSGAFNPYERRWESSSNILKPPTISLSLLIFRYGLYLYHVIRCFCPPYPYILHGISPYQHVILNQDIFLGPGTSRPVPTGMI